MAAMRERENVTALRGNKADGSAQTHACARINCPLKTACNAALRGIYFQQSRNSQIRARCYPTRPNAVSVLNCGPPVRMIKVLLGHISTGENSFCSSCQGYYTLSTDRSAERAAQSGEDEDRVHERRSQERIDKARNRRPARPGPHTTAHRSRPIHVLDERKRFHIHLRTLVFVKSFL